MLELGLLLGGLVAGFLLGVHYEEQVMLKYGMIKMKLKEKLNKWLN